jgi:3-hydroxyacyl-CoA dehydrogenase
MVKGPHCRFFWPRIQPTRRIIVTKNDEIKNVAIVGTGVIGASWTAYYLSRGFSVIATDPAPNAEATLRKYVDEAWKTLSKNGLSPSASRDRLSFVPSMAQALANADFVQENGPERPDFKAKLFAEMDETQATNSLSIGQETASKSDLRCKRTR